MTGPTIIPIEFPETDIHALHKSAVELNLIAKEFLARVKSAKLSRTIPMEEQIIQNVCLYFVISRDVLMSKVRTDKVAFARQLAMYFMSTNLRMTSTAIAKALNRGHHGTVLYAIQHVKERCQVCKTSAAVFNEVKELMQSLRP